MEEHCISCGRCLRVCAQQAKRYISGIENTWSILSSGGETFAVVAPSFPAAFPDVKPEKIIGAIYQLGFQHVWPVAIGADMISRNYAKMAMKESIVTLISTPCPAIVNYIEKHHPALIMFLAPIVSPMIATGRLIRAMHNKGVKIVFIGPCIAKKSEKDDLKVAGIIDEVLTYGELSQMFDEKAIDFSSVSEREMEGPLPGRGALFPISGGLLYTADLKSDILNNDIIITEGPDRVLEVLHRVEEGNIQARFLDLLFCQGCIDGPAIQQELSVFVRKDIVANYVRRKLNEYNDTKQSIQSLPSINLERRFTKQTVSLRVPTEEDIRNILQSINKYHPEDELNCGACGYETCRLKAIAVFQGRAEAEMCLPYLIDRLEVMNKELVEAQQRMISSARLTSMGELAAGVAHEINNPLAGSLNYIKLLRRRLAENPSAADLATAQRYLETMESEITRVSNIVRALLDFARPTEPVIERVSVVELCQKTLLLIRYQISLQNIEIIEDYQDIEHHIRVDFKQFQQVLMNIIINAAQAMPDGGKITIRSHRAPKPGFMQIEIIDTGCGIPKENLSKIFDPFFTTKLKEKGTGLGLSTVYSIVVKHGGSIDVSSEVGVGTNFTITVPIYED